MVEIARREDRCIFTNNYDLIVAASDLGARFIWFHDGLDNSLTKFDTAWLVFRKWGDWEERLSDGSVQCLKVSRNRTVNTTPERARRQAADLDRRRRRPAGTDKEAAGQLVFPELD